MTGLSKITEKILGEARRDAEQKLLEADAECARISAEYAEKASRLRADSDAAARREAQEILSRARSGEAMTSRDTVLKAKGKLVDMAFEKAREEILALDGERYLELLTSMLVSASRAKTEDERLRREYGDDGDEPNITECLVCLSARDLEKYGKALVAKASERLSDSPDTLLLCDTPANIDGGLIFRYGNIEINCSLFTVIGQLRPTLEARVSKRLFPEKRS